MSELQPMQSPVQSAIEKQRSVIACFPDLPLMHHHDLIHGLNGRQPMGDYERGAPGHDSSDGGANPDFGLRINRAGCLIQYENGAIECNRAGKAYQLPLSGGEADALFENFRLIAFWEVCNELIDLNRARGATHR